jgi:hypothetical protein
MWADGGQYSSPGKCYFSEEVYLQEMELRATHIDMYRKMSLYPEPGVTIEDVRAAAKLLRIEI